jgi:hypothetical protein
MTQNNTEELPLGPERHKEISRKLRKMARSAPSAYARKELLRLASSLEYRARHVGRSYRVSGDPDETGSPRTGARPRGVIITS